MDTLSVDTLSVDTLSVDTLVSGHPGHTLVTKVDQQAAIQGTDSAIAAIEAGECIDTGDKVLGTRNAAISPSWLLSVYSCKLT